MILYRDPRRHRFERLSGKRYITYKGCGTRECYDSLSEALAAAKYLRIVTGDTMPLIEALDREFDYIGWVNAAGQLMSLEDF